MTTQLTGLDRSFQQHVRDRVPLAFGHDLVGDPMLGVQAIAELGAALGPDAVSAEVAAKPLLSDYTEATQAGDIRTQILELAANDSWFTLLNIEDDPRYRSLVDRVLDGVAATSDMAPTDLRRRMGFVFASSPGSVTSAHFDIEHSLLFQLEGHRTLGFGRFVDDAHRNSEVERYWSGTSFGRLDTMAEATHDLAIGPGSAVYIPPYTPHWLTNGDSPSLSLTLTFFERSNEDESLVQAFNARLATGHVRTRPYGERPAVDRVKVRAMRAYRGAKRLARRGATERSASH